VLLLAWDANHDWWFRHLWSAYGYLFAALIVVGTGLILKKAFLAGFLGERLFTTSFVLWLVHVCLSVTMYRNGAADISIPLAALTLGGSMLLLPLASIVVAPIALGAQRHS
jgi:hypothetical protein